MTSLFSGPSWQQMEQITKQLRLFEQQLHLNLGEQAAHVGTTILAQQSALSMVASLASKTIGERNAALQAIQTSSAMNVLQAVHSLHPFQSALSPEYVKRYFTQLRSELEHTPDEHELIEHPEMDLILPETRGDLLVYSPSLRLLEELRARRISLHDLTWRQFEEIIAELLHQDGHEVHLGQGTKDGGKDIVAFKAVPGVGLIMSIWQAKKLESHNKVDVDTIKSLADTRLTNGANKGVIVTTTSLTKGARDRIKLERYLLHKIDGQDLTSWIHAGKQP